MREAEASRGGYLDSELHCLVAAAEARSFWARARNDLIVWILEHYFGRARSLLDVGCGTGIVLEHLRWSLPQLELIGCDPYMPALAEARRRLEGVELRPFDICALPYRDRFDVVAALDVLEHVQDDAAALRQIARTVRPGGGVIVAVPQHRWLWSAADEWALHERRYEREKLLGKVEGAGLEVVRATSFVSLLLPLMLLSRLRSRRTTYDPLAEFRLPALADAALGKVLALELALIKRGLDFPAGGSLILVGRKPLTRNP